MSEKSDKPEQQKDRREFIVKLGIGAGLVALVGQAVASLRSLVPNVSYGAPTTVKLGLPHDFPDGMKFLPDQRLFVFREGNIFHAISAVCTHLGCTVQYRPESSQIWCACHNGCYDLSGRNVSGPPPRALDRYEVHVRGQEIYVTRKQVA